MYEPRARVLSLPISRSLPRLGVNANWLLRDAQPELDCRPPLPLGEGWGAGLCSPDFTVPANTTSLTSSGWRPTFPLPEGEEAEK